MYMYLFLLLFLIVIWVTLMCILDKTSSFGRFYIRDATTAGHTV